MTHDVFISYSSADKPTADAICAALEAQRVRCWIAPRDILPGMNWSEAIVLAISSSRLMILVFSANANNSEQIKREVERAAGKQVPIVPFRIENIAPSGALEYFLSAPHWLDALTPPLEQHIRRLAESVKLLLSALPAKNGSGVSSTAHLGADGTGVLSGNESNPSTARPGGKGRFGFEILRTILFVLVAGFCLGGVGGMIVRGLVRSNLVGDLFVPGALFGALGGLPLWLTFGLITKSDRTSDFIRRVSVELLGAVLGGAVGWVLWIVASRINAGNHAWFYGSIGGWLGLSALGVFVGVAYRWKSP